MSLSVEQLKDKLLSCLDEERNVTDMAGALDVITKLQTVPITRESLESSRLGLLINDLRRKVQETNPQLGKLCRGLIKDWQKLVSPSSAPSSGGGKLGISPALDRLTTPSGRSATPRQTAAAKLIAESGLRCSPSPAYTPKLHPSTPLANGSGPPSSGVSPESSNVAHNRPTATSSYAPSEQQSVTNGPSLSALKIRIKYGSADQQASIVREIGTSSPRLSEHSQVANETINVSQGAEEAANRRKRKVPPDLVSKAPLSLVNGGSKSVSPATPVPSPAPSVVKASSPADLAGVNASIKKVTKKSKSSSPDTIPTPAASANLLQRPKLKSTAELVAEMTSSYPETVSINMKNVVPTPASPPVATSMASGHRGSTIMASVLAAAAAASDASDTDDDSKDEDYVEPDNSGRYAKGAWTSLFTGDRSNSGFRGISQTELLDRYLRDHSSDVVDGRRPRRGKTKDKDTGINSESRVLFVHPPIDWYSAVELPPIDFSILESLETQGDEKEGDGDMEIFRSGRDVCDKKTVEMESETDEGKLLDSCVTGDDVDTAASSSNEKQKPDGIQWRSRLLKTAKRGDRQVLAMPYVDIGLPDFIEYGYSNREQYLAHWSER